MDRIKSFVQSVQLINLILIIICIFGFVYQVFLIFSQYMLGKTVVNIEVKIMKDQPLPALTICIPAFFSLPKLSKSSRWNKTHDGLLYDYMNLVNQSLYGNETTWLSLKSNMEAIYNDNY